MIVQISPDIILYGKSIQGLCRHAYYQHPNGCPNYNVKQACPPNQPLIDRVFDFDRELYLVYTEFDIGAHAQRMLQMHPDWTARQAYNCRLWQPRARKIQRLEEAMLLEECFLTKIENSPEAHGVNVTDLFSKLGIELEWPPRSITRLVSLAGYSL